MFRKKKKPDYKTGSLAREDFYIEVESLLKEKGIEYDSFKLHDLVDSYSDSDTEKMSRIFMDILRSI